MPNPITALGTLHPLNLADLAAMIRALQKELRERAKTEEEFRRTLILLANQAGDFTHASIETAAAIRRCSVRTIKRRLKAREYTLEVIPGTRITGIPIEQLSRDWVPISVVRRARERQRKERAEHGATTRR